MVRFLALLLLVVSVNSHAYKVETHAWVGQQVINDLKSDGKITFILNGKVVTIPVKEDIVNTILNNQNEYLLGHIGPDAAPDILVGQSIIHPGEGDWNVAHWLGFLLDANNNPQLNSSDLLQAYSYGFLGHAASDMFAHTYVNKYSGDQFSLEDETLVEIRHIALEGFIDNLTPTITDGNTSWSNANQRITISNDYANMIRDTFVYNDTVQAVYDSTDYGSHLKAYWDYRTNVDEIAEAGIWHEIDKWVTQIAARTWLNIELSDAEASKIVDAAQPVIDILDGPVVDGIQEAANTMYEISSKLESLELKGYENLHEEAKDAEQKLLNTQHEIEQLAINIDQSLTDMSCELIDASISLDPTGITAWLLEHDPLLSFIADLFGIGRSRPEPRIISFKGTKSELIEVKQELLGNIYQRNEYSSELWDDECRFGIESACVQIDTNNWMNEEDKNVIALIDLEVTNFPENAFVEKEVCHWEDFVPPRRECRTVRIPYEGQVTYVASVGGVSTDYGGTSALGKICYAFSNYKAEHLTSLYNVKKQLENRLLHETQDYRQKFVDLKAKMIEASDTAHQTANAFIDLNQVVGADVSPIQALLRGWRADLDAAMSAYVKANAQVMLNSTDPNLDTLEPLEVWLKCYHAQLIGIPSVIGNSCEDGLANSIQKLISSLKQIIEILDNIVAPNGLDIFNVKNKLDEIVNNTVENLNNKLREVVSDELYDLVPDEFQTVIEVTADNITDSKLNSYYNMTQGNGGKSLLYITDMSNRVRRDMNISSEEVNFDVEQFAVIYNSILLSKLSLLDSDGLAILSESAELPYDTFGYSNNIIANSITNIDGNHQWMSISPPLPNSENYYLDENDSFSTSEGFIPWRENNRNKLFNGLFKGPLTPNLDVMFSGNNLAGNNYPYKVCSSNPFPSSLLDSSCMAIILIPILSGMMN